MSYLTSAIQVLLLGVRDGVLVQSVIFHKTEDSMEKTLSILLSLYTPQCNRVNLSEIFQEEVSYPILRLTLLFQDSSGKKFGRENFEP